MRPQPYIGVSGLTRRAEVLFAIDAFPNCDRLLMLGVLASEKTLAGQRNRWWRRYPPVQCIGGIFIDEPRCLNLVHYASDEPPDSDTLLRLFNLAGPHCDGFQFNCEWPRIGDLGTLLRAFDRAGRAPRIVLQIGPRLLERRLSPRDVAALLIGYHGVVSDVLIDASGGSAQPVDPARADAFVDRLRATWPTLGVGVAGGLCAETLPIVAPIVASGVSCDAEGKLRDGTDGGGNMVQSKVSAYLHAAGEAVSR